MTMTNFTDLTARTRSGAQGLVRDGFGRIMEARERQVRRYSPATTSFYGAERLDLSHIERRSYFDTASPERC